LKEKAKSRFKESFPIKAKKRNRKKSKLMKSFKDCYYQTRISLMLEDHQRVEFLILPHLKVQMVVLYLLNQDKKN
jgi:hypothetical protein